MASKSFRFVFSALLCGIVSQAPLFASDSAEGNSIRDLFNQQWQFRTRAIHRRITLENQIGGGQIFPAHFPQDELEATTEGGASQKFRYYYEGGSLRGLQREAAESLTKITIPSRIMFIGENSFGGYTKLQEVTLKEGVRKIEPYAFQDCFNLRTINLPETSLRTIRYDAFNGCYNLKTINIPNSVTSIGNSAFEDCLSLKNIHLPENLSTLSSQTFRNCLSLEQIILPNSLTSIEGGVFYGCLSLRSIQIPEGTLSLGESVFADCSSLQSVEIPNSVTSIRKGVFSSCSALERINLPSEITSIPEETFFECKKLKEVVIPNGVTSIGVKAFFGCSKLERVTLPQTLTSISANAFAGCKKLKRIEIPDSVKEIAPGAFCGCSALEEVILPKGLTFLGARAFAGCEALPTVTLPESLKSLDLGVFDGCKKLKEITLPKGLAAIDSYAFADCTELESVIIPESVVFIGRGGFKNCEKISALSFPGKVRVLDAPFEGCKKLKHISFGKNGGDTYQISDLDDFSQLPEDIIVKETETLDLSSAVLTSLPHYFAIFRREMGKAPFSGCSPDLQITLPRERRFASMDSLKSNEDIKTLRLEYDSDIFPFMSVPGSFKLPPFLENLQLTLKVKDGIALRDTLLRSRQRISSNRASFPKAEDQAVDGLLTPGTLAVLIPGVPKGTRVHVRFQFSEEEEGSLDIGNDDDVKTFLSVLEGNNLISPPEGRDLDQGAPSRAYVQEILQGNLPLERRLKASKNKQLLLTLLGTDAVKFVIRYEEAHAQSDPDTLYLARRLALLVRLAHGLPFWELMVNSSFLLTNEFLRRCHPLPHFSEVLEDIKNSFRRNSDSPLFCPDTPRLGSFVRALLWDWFGTEFKREPPRLRGERLSGCFTQPNFDLAANSSPAFQNLNHRNIFRFACDSMISPIHLSALAGSSEAFNQVKSREEEMGELFYEERAMVCAILGNNREILDFMQDVDLFKTSKGTNRFFTAALLTGNEEVAKEVLQDDDERDNSHLDAINAHHADASTFPRRLYQLISHSPSSNEKIYWFF